MPISTIGTPLVNEPSKSKKQKKNCGPSITWFLDTPGAYAPFSHSN